LPMATCPRQGTLAEDQREGLRLQQSIIIITVHVNRIGIV